MKVHFNKGDSMDWLEEKEYFDNIKKYIEKFVIGEVIIENIISFTSIYPKIGICIKNKKFNYKFSYIIEKPLKEITENDIDEILNIYKQYIIKEFFW